MEKIKTRSTDHAPRASSWIQVAVAAAAVVLALAAPPPASAQEPISVTIEGCLTAGSRPGYFAFLDDATGNQVTVAGLAELAQHADNHRERITGTFAKDDGLDTLRASSLEHVADSCTPVVRRVTQRVREVVRGLRRRAAFGIRGGFALDPELIIIGAHAEFNPIMENLVFRPNFEFGLGEVTAEYAANFEAVYRLPFLRESSNRLDVWSVYVGGGPSFTFFNQEFRERDFNIENPGDFQFDDWDTDIAFNVLVGLTRRNGFFAELKAGAYGSPDVRVLLGYTF